MGIDTHIHTTCTVSNSLEFKQELLEAAPRIKTMQDYCAFAFQRLHEYLRMDSASLNLAAIESDMKLKALSCYYYRQQESMGGCYKDNNRKSYFTPSLIIHSGIALHTHSLVPEGGKYSVSPSLKRSTL